jgi:hypothetical protein
MSRKLFRRSAATAFVVLAAILTALTGSADVIPLTAANFPPITPPQS